MTATPINRPSAASNVRNKAGRVLHGLARRIAGHDSPSERRPSLPTPYAPRTSDAASTDAADVHRPFDGIPRMPAMFGRQPGPRQRLTEPGFHRVAAGTLVTWVAARVEQTALAALMPPGFEVTEPLLIIEAMTLSDLPWLAGRGYEMLMASTPVTYTAADGTTTTGRLELVTWEDCPDAIVSGREELGFNKVYADTMSRHGGASGDTIRYTASWGGTKFFELNATLSRGVAQLAEWRKGPLMHYRVLPRTGNWDGELEVEQVVAHSASAPLTAMRSLRSATGTFQFHRATFEELPTLVHVVNALADIAVLEVVDAGQARTKSWSDVRDATIISVSDTHVHAARANTSADVEMDVDVDAGSEVGTSSGEQPRGLVSPTPQP